MSEGAAPPLQGAVPGTYVRLLFEYLTRHGVDAQAVLQEPAPAPVERGLDRYPVARWRQLLEAAAASLGDPLLGLHVGRTITPAHLGVMGYVLIACGTLGAAMQRFGQYQRLVYDVNPLEYRLIGDQLELEWGVAAGRPGSLVDECASAALVQFARDLSGGEWPVSRVEFVNPAPADVVPYTDYFGREVCFGADATRVRIAACYLQRPLRQPDATLLALLSRQADVLLEQLPEAGTLEQAVRRSVVDQLRHGPPALEAVAATLHLSPRTLHRRLAERGTRFCALREDTRRRLAEDYLGDPRLQLAEIAQLLGFSEQSAFNRAFVRWTGTSPGRFRRRLSA